jgi:hypothetical protein
VVGCAVAGELDEVERMMDRHRAREVADERDARLQAPDEHRFPAREVACDVGAQLSHTRSDLVGVEEDLADALVESCRPGQDAFRSP